jgi:hypothetical protein
MYVEEASKQAKKKLICYERKVTHFEETFFYYYIHKTFPYCGINI